MSEKESEEKNQGGSPKFEIAKCPKCGYEIADDENLEISGVADVHGTATLRGFREDGIEWEAHDSWNEQAQCPKCQEWFSIQV